MNKKFASSLAVAALLMCGTSYAGGTCYGCKIKSIGIGPYYDSICTASSGACAFVAMDAVPGTKPGCSSNSFWHFVLDIGTSSGKATYAFLLAAKASGEIVNVAGSNYCTLSPSGTVEDLHFANNPG